MAEARLSTDLYVGAYVRQAMREGVPMTVIRRGDPSSGSLILKINLLNGTARVLIEARFHEERVWTPALPADPMPDKDADAYLSQQADIDPDAWLIEIEDKQGRTWFPGKIVAL
ncbi:MAG: DUF1491 family protein [Alphaproteobacteria bacterium]|nr:DUF1491 family protein [Alphaproteobacteria bacterium]